MEITQAVAEAIRKLLPNAHIEVLDPMRDGQHIEAVVVAAEFDGMPLIKQHQLIMRGLKSHFDQGLHALKLTTLTPTQWEQKKS